VSSNRILVKSEVIEFILGVSTELHPREFTGQLRWNEGIISEVLIIPASTYGEGFAETRRDMIPIDGDIIGSVHSHPTHNFRPSNADLRYFKKMGEIHLIARYAYEGIQDIAAYDNLGNSMGLDQI